MRCLSSKKTHLAYASTVRMRDDNGEEKPVSHTCGHDMHVACLMAAPTFYILPLLNGKAHSSVSFSLTKNVVEEHRQWLMMAYTARAMLQFPMLCSASTLSIYERVCGNLRRPQFSWQKCLRSQAPRSRGPWKCPPRLY